MIESTNPATGETIQQYSEMSATEVDGILDRVAAAAAAWRLTDFAPRSAGLLKAAELLRQGRDEYAELMAREMGKPLEQGRSEVDKCAWVCEYYTQNAADFLEDEHVDLAGDAERSFVSFQPLGVVLAVMPWNFPFWQVFRFAAPSLMAGNGAVLKHASNVPGCALAIEDIFGKAGLPSDLFRTLLIPSGGVARVIEHPAVRAVTLTGSTPAGKAVAAAAGAALKKSVLELGGSDPYVVLADADLDGAVDACVTSRLINSGQSCIAAKRFIVVESVREEFERRFTEAMKTKRVGDPGDPRTDVGPQARTDLRNELHAQVERSIAAGARCLLGGELPDSTGAYYPITVLTDVGPGMPAYDEELFGPVAAIIPVAGEEEAIATANDSPFGLGAAVFSGDVDHAEELARDHLEAGSCFVNGFVRSDPRLPFGGIKESGYGRELGPFGIREFVNVKTVWVE